MNGSEQIEYLRLLDERLERADVSQSPYEMRLDVKDLTSIKIAGYTHLPIEKQLIAWAIARGYLASEVPTESGVIRITKQQ